MSNKNNNNTPKQENNSTLEKLGNDPQEEENIEKFEESLEYFGQKIKETRISNNLSLESISGHLHISVKILQAIEEGKPENGPTPVFFRGLVRTYCQFLELDKTNIVDKLDLLLKKESPDENVSTKTLKPVFSINNSSYMRNILTILVILIGGYLLYFFYFSQTRVDNLYDNVTKTKNESKETDVSQKNLKYSQNTYSKKEESSKTTLEAKNTEDLKYPKNGKQILSPINEQNNSEPLTLEIEASDATWVSVGVDNHNIQDFRIQADEIQQWEAKKKFFLTIGNTKAVRVLLNGREIETNRKHDLLSNWLVDSSYLP